MDCITGQCPASLRDGYADILFLDVYSDPIATRAGGDRLALIELSWSVFRN
jgi:hypothetical protein